MAINSKAKGNRAERELCKWWKDWSSFDFSRTPSSGGLRWKKVDNTTSDIICTDDKHSRRFPLSIECKNYKGITFNDIIKGTKSDILKFWDQTTLDAERGNKIPILCMRENGMSKGVYYIVVNIEVGKFILLNNLLSKSYLRIHHKGLDLYVFNSNDLKVIDYMVFYKEMKRILKGK